MFPPKYRRGGPPCFSKRSIIAAVHGHPSLLFEEGLSHVFLVVPAETVTVERLKPSFSGAHTHTHVCPPMHKTDTHTHTAILYHSRANLLKENSFVYIILDYVSFGRKTADWARCRAKVKVMRYPNK